MKTDSRNKSTRKPVFYLIAAAVVLAVLVGVGAYMVYNQSLNPVLPPSEPASNINFDPPTEEEKQASTAKKEQLVGKPGDESQPTTNSDIVVSITRAGQVGQVISVRAYVDGASSGKCDISFTKDGQDTVNQDVDIVFETTTSHCNADVDVSKFNVSGDWNMSITASKDGSVSEPTTQVVTVNK